MNILQQLLGTAIRVAAIPVACMVYFLTWTWYGMDVYGAIYHRSELGKWPDKRE